MSAKQDFARLSGKLYLGGDFVAERSSTSIST